MITLKASSFLALILFGVYAPLLRVAGVSLMIPLVPLVVVLAVDALRRVHSAREQPRVARILPPPHGRYRDTHELVFRYTPGVPRVLARLRERRLGSQLPAVGSIKALTRTHGGWFSQRGWPD